MKRMLLLIFPLLLSCGSAVVVDYDQATEFEGYRTYNFYPSIVSGLSELDDKRIVRVTDSLLKQKGFRKSETPQLYINFFVKERLSASNSSIGIGVGGGGRHGGVGVSGGIPIGGNTIEQNFTLDMIDVVKDGLIWQGQIIQNYPEKATAEQMDQHYEKILTALLKKFPPKTQ